MNPATNTSPARPPLLRSPFSAWPLLLVLGLAGALLLSACADDFLTRLPEDEIASEDFWNSPGDLRTYVNQFYAGLPGFPGYGLGVFQNDNNSDNQVGNSYSSRLAGLNTVNAGNGIWGSQYERIRDANYMLANVPEGEALTEEAKRYVGVARWFRAYSYFQLLKAYGAVPWVSRPLRTDSEELFGQRTPRDQVADSVMADLDYAIEWVPSITQTGGNRVNKETALALKSRVGLFEGTWEKYHQGTAFGVEGAEGARFLEGAVEAVERLMELGTAELYSTGDPAEDYFNLFWKTDLSGNAEVFLWRRYDVSQNMSHNLQRFIGRTGGGTGLTKSLVESYLTETGEPIAASPLYRGDETLEQVVAHRDPRLGQTILVPGDTVGIKESGEAATFEKPALGASVSEERNTTGYQLKKGMNPMGDPGLFQSETARILFRYAEALLNYAEAKAELAALGAGSISQGDLDRSVNKIRARVGMPPLVKGDITTDPNWSFPRLSPLINEIRRERRVELAAEGFRQEDLLRWRAAGDLVIGERPLGAKFDPEEYPEATVGEDLYVSEGGYVDPLQSALPGGYGFDPGRDYLLAVPPQELTLNEDLQQNPGW